MKNSVRKTLTYADLFDYPLTLNELHFFLLTKERVSLTAFKKHLSHSFLTKEGISFRSGYYFFPGREKILKIRKKREEYSGGKFLIAEKAAEKIKKISWVRMVGVTGALSMMNAKEEDDIDLMIVTSTNRLWLTRLTIFILGFFWKINRRKPKETNPKDKICFNLFLEEGFLKIPCQNLFLAHEIVQIKPLADKGKIYEKLLLENSWIFRFLPNTEIIQKRKHLKFF